MIFVDLTGHRYGRLLILGRDHSWKKKNAKWLYLCDCGRRGSAIGSNLRSGASTSCGCFRTELLVERYTTHGQCVGGGVSPTLQSWRSMWSRVTDPKHKDWKYYGGRGVTVCDRWKKFENFLEDMGERPEGMTVERGDPDGNYEPDNCVWADGYTQANNQRGQAKWLINSQLMTKAQAERYWGVPAYWARKRLSTLPLAEGAAPKWFLPHHSIPQP